MAGAEHWSGIGRVFGVADLLLHRLPVFNAATSNATANMEARSTTLVVALNAAALLFLATATSEVEPVSLKSTFNLNFLIVFEPDFRCPVNTDNMGPQGRFALASSGGSNSLDSAIDIRAQEALNLSALLLGPEKLLTSVTVPVAVWDLVPQLASIA